MINQFIVPASSNIKRLAYDDEKALLEVEFRNGRKYQYNSVPISVWVNFLASKSKGKYFSKYIKGQYNFNKIFQKPEIKPLEPI